MVLVTLLLIVGVFPSLASAAQSPIAGKNISAYTPHRAPTAAPPISGAPADPGGLQCDGMYWSDSVWATYSPAWCYGHDEPTMTYVSTAPGSGANANYSLTLPADGSYTQGDFYATIWFGGVVYDPGSLDSQAYLEFQVYPAPPYFTGTGSGTQDCLANGAFYPNYTPGSNTWFACADVWQAINCSPTCTENAAFAGPMDALGTTSILEFQSNDHLYLNLSGTAQSTTQPWQITLTDTTTHVDGTIALKNGTKVLSPYYSTAAAANTLYWGASQPGAIAMSYEIGHSLNPAIPEGGPYGACYPGDHACDSYWPGRWAQSGQLQLTLPVMGSPGSRTFPTQIAFSSSVGGESWINNTGGGSTCPHPNWSAATNCIYPWYIYRGQNYSFTFDTSNLTNDTHDYGNWYEFPAVSSTHAVHAAPWGTLNSVVTPATATVEFNPLRTIHPLTVLSNGSFSGQFMEGPYWLNVSEAGCTPSSSFVYLKTGAVYNTPVTLVCAGLFPVTFNESGLAPGTSWSVTLNGSTVTSAATSIVIYSTNGTKPFQVPPAAGTPGVRYVATPNSGNVTVKGVPLLQNETFAVQYQFTGMASSASAGVVVPASVWAVPATVIPVTATPNSPWAFGSWVGIGTGSYTGTANPTSVTMNGPVLETAVFVFRYTVSFTESGLPSGASWSVELNRVYLNGTASSVQFLSPNGSYFFNISGPAGYTITPPSGSGSVQGGNVAIQVQFAKPILFGLTLVELELLSLVVGAVVVAIVLAVVLSRRKPPPPAPPPAQPPSWLGGPPSQ